MVLNGSDLLNQPWNTTFSPYIVLLGQGWLLIPVSFIAAALFMKTRDPVLLAMFMIVSGAFLTAGGLFTSFGSSAVFAYVIFTVIGIAVMFYNVFYGGR